MKLEMTLPGKPGFLHVLPGLDILALVLLFPLMGNSFVRQAGMDVVMHESPWRYQQMDQPVVVTLGVDGSGSEMGVAVWVNKEEVKIDSLEMKIRELLAEEGGDEITTVVVRSDVHVPSGVEKDVINRVLKMGLHCGLLGKPVDGR